MKNPYQPKKISNSYDSKNMSCDKGLTYNKNLSYNNQGKNNSDSYRPTRDDYVDSLDLINMSYEGLTDSKEDKKVSRLLDKSHKLVNDISKNPDKEQFYINKFKKENSKKDVQETKKFFNEFGDDVSSKPLKTIGQKL